MVRKKKKKNNFIQVTKGVSSKTKCLLILPLPRVSAGAQFMTLSSPESSSLFISTASSKSFILLSCFPRDRWSFLPLFKMWYILFFLVRSIRMFVCHYWLLNVSIVLSCLEEYCFVSIFVYSHCLNFSSGLGTSPFAFLWF